MATLYNTYRPSTWEAVVGQSGVIDSVRGGLLSGKHSHAYLMSGPRGTGKTTVARLIATHLNCLNEEPRPCGHCEQCMAVRSGEHLDIIEIDAASNSGVDTIRAVIERVYFAPVSGEYKVYIIDEAHQLSAGAANALLKTLEEPPSHVVFVLATTEEHKIIPTIQSRCQVHRFRLIPNRIIAEKLEEVLKVESQLLDSSVLDLIVQASRGAMRDGLSLLSTVLSLEDRSYDNVRLTLGKSDVASVIQFVDVLSYRNVGEILSFIDGLCENDNVDIQVFVRDVIEHLRMLMHIKVGSNVYKNVPTHYKAQSWDLALSDIILALKAMTNFESRFAGPRYGLELAITEVITKMTSPTDF